MKEMPVYFEVTDMRKSSWTSRKQQQKMLESIKKKAMLICLRRKVKTCLYDANMNI